ncbi:MAG: chemotaxis protein CheW [Deltaproteobacteria bacterium]
MEKPVGEDELKGLEEEIDSAVDRLFVEETKGLAQNLSMESPVSGPSLEIEKPHEVLSAPPPEKETRVVFEKPVLEKPFLEKPSSKPSPSPPSRQIEDDFFREKPSPVALPVYEEELSLVMRGEGVEQDFFAEKPSPPASVSAPVSDPMERIETHLLSLEWEITNEGIEKTKEMVIDLRNRWSGQPEIISVSNRMEKALDFMLKSDANIHPSLIKFLMDAKDTIKVLSQRETTHETKMVKQLVYDGIEARFLALTGVREAQTKKPLPELPDAGDRAVLPEAGWKRIEEIADQINLFSATMHGALEKIEQRLSRLEKQTLNPREEEGGQPSPGLTVMVFKLEGKLFGVRNEQVFKLFKVPATFRDKYVDQQRIRVRNVDVKLVDLKKLFSIQEEGPERELKILIVKDDGEYKGLMIEQVLQKISTRSDLGKGTSDYFMGSIPWTYQERPVEISVLDVKKL